MGYLQQINSPQDLKKLKITELDKLAEEIRFFLLKTVANTGGHLASNLGVVELTLALHYLFDTSKDRLVWDVGHQSYVHKILTGRKDVFYGLRQFGGLSGFPSERKAFMMLLIPVIVAPLFLLLWGLFWRGNSWAKTIRL